MLLSFRCRLSFSPWLWCALSNRLLSKKKAGTTTCDFIVYFTEVLWLPHEEEADYHVLRGQAVNEWTILPSVTLQSQPRTHDTDWNDRTLSYNCPAKLLRKSWAPIPQAHVLSNDLGVSLTLQQRATATSKKLHRHVHQRSVCHLKAFRWAVHCGTNDFVCLLIPWKQ